MQGIGGSLSSPEPTSSIRGPVATPSPFPYGLDNAAAAYSPSVLFAMSSYAGLPEHHLHSTLKLLVTTTDFEEGSDAWAGANFSRLRDLEAMRQFMGACDCLFGYSDSDGESYDSSRECFHVEIEEVALGGDAPVGQGDRTPP